MSDIFTAKSPAVLYIQSRFTYPKSSISASLAAAPCFLQLTGAFGRSLVAARRQIASLLYNTFLSTLDVYARTATLPQYSGATHKRRERANLVANCQ